SYKAEFDSRSPASSFAPALSSLAKLPVSYYQSLALVELAGLADKACAWQSAACAGLATIRVRALSIAARGAEQINNAYALSVVYAEMGRNSLELARRASFYADQLSNPELDYRQHWQLGRLYFQEKNLQSAVTAYERAAASLDKVRAKLAYTHYQYNPLDFKADIEPVYLQLAELYLKRGENAGSEAVRQAFLEHALDTVERLKVAQLQDYFQDDCVRMLSQNKKVEKWLD
ncbi:MAG: hypothetical protein GY862_06660, partial [Gammaproteobacteria bacterium]|nr:hypothetical protein [Gammaproteobacteria bacterium]